MAKFTVGDCVRLKDSTEYAGVVFEGPLKVVEVNPDQIAYNCTLLTTIPITQIYLENGCFYSEDELIREGAEDNVIGEWVIKVKVLVDDPHGIFTNGVSYT